MNSRLRDGPTQFNRKEFGKITIDRYVEAVNAVWSNFNKRRTVWDYTLHLLDHASSLGEAIRVDDAQKILQEMAETTNWLFAFVAKLNDKKSGWESRLNIPDKLSAIIWRQYPKLCPHCFQTSYIQSEGKASGLDIAEKLDQKCRLCLPNYPGVERRSGERNYEEWKEKSDDELEKYARKSISKMPTTLKTTETMMRTIYKSNVALATIENIGFHLLEETGEVARAVIDIYTTRFKKKDKPLPRKQRELCDEIAQMFAWLCSLCEKVRSDAKTFDNYKSEIEKSSFPTRKTDRLQDKIGLEQILWTTYLKPPGEEKVYYTCRYCHESPCICDKREGISFGWEGKS